MTLRKSRSNKSVTSSKRKSQSSRKGKKVVTGDTTAKRVSIFTGQDEGEEDSDDNVNLVSEYNTQSTKKEHDDFEFFQLNQKLLRT